LDIAEDNYRVYLDACDEDLKKPKNDWSAMGLFFICSNSYHVIWGITPKIGCMKIQVVLLTFMNLAAWVIIDSENHL
jgi:hypothetical protein